ncbi:MAG: hypothetical protein CVU00_14260 [Bacteroidetes bacterium HGW-Bacteroidetes-17]|nr:MAG: hypothetical protein CVU00_14260 [Bacteroidetes bacterium HGW-Bacteroidetes-17]
MKTDHSLRSFLFIGPAVLILFIAIITLLVYFSVNEDLSTSTLEILINRQQVIGQSIKQELVDNPRLVSQMLPRNPNELTIDTIKELLRHLKSELPYCKQLWLYFLNQNGQWSVVSDNETRTFQPPNPLDLKKDMDTMAVLSYSDQMILRHGKPYRDEMDLNTVIPIVVTFYPKLVPQSLLYLEMDITRMLGSAYQSIRNPFGPALTGEGYSVAIYTSDGQLLESTLNIPKKTIQPLQTYNTDLLPSDRDYLYTSGRYSRTTTTTIELFSLHNGYLIKGMIPRHRVITEVSKITFFIIGLGLASTLLLTYLGFVLMRIRSFYEEQIRIQLETMQAKLDPHFIFNIMNSMVALAVKDDRDSLLASFKSLSLLLRSSITEKRVGIPLVEEMEYINCYVDLQHIRFEDTFAFISDIPEEMLHYKVPRFSIQPLIENSFVHAVAQPARNTVKIVLKGWTERKSLHLRISDNGPGCSSEMLEQIRTMLGKHANPTSSGIGLTIVHRRIRLLYGRRYGIIIPEQPQNRGFAVEIALPLLVDFTTGSE